MSLTNNIYHNLTPQELISYCASDNLLIYKKCLFKTLVAGRDTYLNHSTESKLSSTKSALEQSGYDKYC